MLVACIWFSRRLEDKLLSGLLLHVSAEMLRFHSQLRTQWVSR